MTICQNCVFVTHPVMLTGYCIQGNCDLCDRWSDLAMVTNAESFGKLIASNKVEGIWRQKH